MKKRAHIYFIGNVQGVGFRYVTQRLASNLGLVGWVKNLPNGQVEVIAEGDEGTIQELLAQLQENFRGSIKDYKVNFQDTYNQFNSFEITH